MKQNLWKKKTRTSKPYDNKEFYDKIKLLIGVDYKNKKQGYQRKIKNEINRQLF